MSWLVRSGWLLFGYILFCAGQPAPEPNLTMNIPSNAQPVLTYRLCEPRVATAIRKAIILLHGVGSNENDLFALADRLPDDLYVITARGPFTLGPGNVRPGHPGPGRYAWYSVDFSSGRPVYDTGQEATSRARIAQFIAEMRQTYQLDTVYVGGFSQGGIMSYGIGLIQPQIVKGVVVLSGRLLEEIKPLVADADTLAKLNVFIAHGTQDNVLSIDYARSAKQYLDSLHVPVSYHEYALGHSIGGPVIRDLNAWLARH